MSSFDAENVFIVKHDACSYKNRQQKLWHVKMVRYYFEEYFNNQPVFHNNTFGIKNTVISIDVSGRIQEDFKHSIKTPSLRFLCTEIYTGAGFISEKINTKLKKDALQVLVLQKCVTVPF